MKNNILIKINTQGRKFHKGDFKIPNICGVPVIPIYDEGKVTHYGVKLSSIHEAVDKHEVTYNEIENKIDEMRKEVDGKQIKVVRK